MPVDEAVAAATAGVWVDQSAAAAAQVTSAATATTGSAWGTFTSWYSTTAVTAQATEMAEISASGQDAIVGMFSQYVAELVAMLNGSRVSVPDVRARPVRNGVSLLKVHARPANLFKETFALLGDEYEAQRRAMQRAADLMAADMMLAARQAQIDAMEALGVTNYRRVLRPELSDDGPCGLCVVAADKIYTIKELLPLHDRCKCETMPLAGGVDLARRLNKDDLERIYAAAGDSTNSRDLKRVRVTINEHGELGPVLSTRGHRFRGPEDLDRKKSRDEVSKRLAKLHQVLDEFKRREADGENLTDPVEHQEHLIESAEADLAAAGGSSSGGGKPPAPPSPAPDDDDWFEGIPLAGSDVEHPDYRLLTEQEKDDLAWYASAGHQALNAALWGEIPMTAELRRMGDSIRGALRKYTLPTTIRVTRTTELAYLGVADYDDLPTLQDKNLEQLGFLSTSVSPVAQPIKIRQQPVAMELIVYGGTHALRIRDELADPNNVNERELLVIDGRRIRVIKVFFSDAQQRWIVRARVLPEA